MGRKTRCTEYGKGVAALASKKKKATGKGSVLSRLKKLKEGGNRHGR